MIFQSMDSELPTAGILRNSTITSPAPTIRLPREKPLTVCRPPTAWETFAKSLKQKSQERQAAKVGALPSFSPLLKKGYPIRVVRGKFEVNHGLIGRFSEDRWFSTSLLTAWHFQDNGMCLLPF
ncbi:hypothetical protein MKW98_007431 [Papaver atlanticum]|uniref:Ribosome biogenesis regulatory protein n=1 Tax=Papaver atlanticum TaxID=357466 RepID=A0AAD4SCJ7_9MAGN|nr:hypothetical protein MKW98_007431 [Papaver atlanticum]